MRERKIIFKDGTCYYVRSFSPSISGGFLHFYTDEHVLAVMVDKESVKAVLDITELPDYIK